MSKNWVFPVFEIAHDNVSIMKAFVESLFFLVINLCEIIFGNIAASTSVGNEKHKKIIFRSPLISLR